MARDQQPHSGGPVAAELMRSVAGALWAVIPPVGVAVVVWMVVSSMWTGPDGLGTRVWAAIAARDHDAFTTSVPAVVAVWIVVPTIRAVWRRCRNDTPTGRRWIPRFGDDTRHVAAHEAAHTVAALAMGGRVSRADIIRTEGRGGGVRTQPPPGAGYGAAQWCELVVALAGHVADIDAGREDQGSTSDMDDAMFFGLGVLSSGRRPPGYDGPWTLDGLVLAAIDTARDILAIHTSARTELADALYRTAGLIPLSGSRVDAIWAHHRATSAPDRAAAVAGTV